MSNTQTRILSALVIILICFYSIWHSVFVSKAVILILAVFCFYEFSRKIFLNKDAFAVKTISFFYILALFFCFYEFFPKEIVLELGKLSLAFAVGLNLLLLVYLFLSDIKNMSLILLLKKMPMVYSLYLFTIFMSISQVFELENWRLNFLGTLLISSVTDTAAWFFGKNFGKKKLWVEVSPNKTRVGFVFGVLVSTLVLGIYISYFKLNFSFSHIAFIAILSVFAQLGDLVQSKIKRQVGVKDSSSLIPGHGGVYDRMDSIFFVAPVYYMYLIYL